MLPCNSQLTESRCKDRLGALELKVVVRGPVFHFMLLVCQVESSSRWFSGMSPVKQIQESAREQSKPTFDWSREARVCRKSERRSEDRYED